MVVSDLSVSWIMEVAVSFFFFPCTCKKSYDVQIFSPIKLIEVVLAWLLIRTDVFGSLICRGKQKLETKD